ncbi:MAG: dihydroneopterin aldolase [Parvularculaceae bacterium]
MDSARTNFPSPRPAQRAAETQVIYIRDLELDAAIGVHEYEKARKQKILINIDVAIAQSGAAVTDALADAYCYESLCDKIKEIVCSRHFNLVETLAEEIAAAAMSHPLAERVHLKIEKPEALATAGGAGIEIYRLNDSRPETE